MSMRFASMEEKERALREQEKRQRQKEWDERDKREVEKEKLAVARVKRAVLEKRESERVLVAEKLTSGAGGGDGDSEDESNLSLYERERRSQERMKDRLERGAVVNESSKAAKDSGLFGMDAEIAKRKEAKAGDLAELEEEARDWVSKVASVDCFDIYESLKSGVVLCNLMNSLVPGAIPKFNSRPIGLMQRENIQFYLNACSELGVAGQDLFNISDLADQKNFDAVVKNIHALGRVAQSVPGYLGPTLGRPMSQAEIDRMRATLATTPPALRQRQNTNAILPFMSTGGSGRGSKIALLRSAESAEWKEKRDIEVHKRNVEAEKRKREREARRRFEEAERQRVKVVAAKSKREDEERRVAELAREQVGELMDELEELRRMRAEWGFAAQFGGGGGGGGGVSRKVGSGTNAEDGDGDDPAMDDDAFDVEMSEEERTKAARDASARRRSFMKAVAAKGSDFMARAHQREAADAERRLRDMQDALTRETDLVKFLRSELDTAEEKNEELENKAFEIEDWASQKLKDAQSNYEISQEKSRATKKELKHAQEEVHKLSPRPSNRLPKRSAARADDSWVRHRSPSSDPASGTVDIDEEAMPMLPPQGRSSGGGGGGGGGKGSMAKLFFTALLFCLVGAGAGFALGYKWDAVSSRF